MTRGTALSGLLRRFAALSRDNRDHVLGLLGQAEREALHLALSETAGTALSPKLANLVDHCRSDDLPTAITEHAARALLIAVDAVTGVDSIDQALHRSLPRPGRWRHSLRREARTS